MDLLRNAPSRSTIQFGVTESQFHVPDTFPTHESAIEAAIQAGRQKIDVGFERGRAVVNGRAPLFQKMAPQSENTLSTFFMIAARTSAENGFKSAEMRATRP